MAPLVDYSSDSSSEPDASQSAAKRRKLDPGIPASSDKPIPALPASFYSLYATNVRTTTADDPSLHGGRTRQVAHKEGNWPTHVYLEWYPTERQEHEIGTVITTAQRAVPETHNFLRSNLDVQLPLHISLSAPLVLDTSQRDAFFQFAQSAVNDSGARSFTVNPTAVSWVPNFDGTRHFLVLKLTTPRNDDLNRLLSACNACAREFALSELYHDTSTATATPAAAKGKSPEDKARDDCFHISVAWTLHAPSEEERAAAEQLLHAHLQHVEISFDTVKVKIGNAVHDLPLLPQTASPDHPTNLSEELAEG